LNAERENYIVLLLGSAEGPIPTVWHLQKEMFLLSRAIPKVQGLFNFEKHYEGPYCQALQEQSKEPFYLADAYGFDNAGRLHLTMDGRKIFSAIIKQYQSNERFMRMFNSMKLIRSIYDKLQKDELLLLVYVSYPEFIDLSNAYDRLVKDAEKRGGLAKGLLEKGVITQDRYKEIVNLKVVE
jgi:hypothetical protein